MQHRDDCTRWCGNISVPFPFGLEEGCSARQIFRLNCTNATSSVLFLDDLNVTNINVDEGLIEYTSSIGIAEYFLAVYLGQRLYTDSKGSGSRQWAVANLTCLEAQRSASSYACVSTQSTCVPVINSIRGYFGYRCKCSSGFHGNPYIKNGCQGKPHVHASALRVPFVVWMFVCIQWCIS